MRTTSLALLLTFLAACGDSKEADADGDGIEAPADCDDNNADIKPGAVELCDGIDNDCDAQIDEGVAQLYYPDGDGDGAGDLSAVPTPLCAPEAGFAQNTNDCDDGDATVYVGATEDCTPIDRNCDGDPFGGATDLIEWFVDSDGDGFGSPDASQNSCAQPANYVDNSDDCDDFRELVYPGAEEVCNNLDDDCNGTVDDGATDAEYLFVDADADGYGDPATGGQLCPGFGTTDDGTDCDDTNDQINPGQRDVCDGLDNDCDPTTSEDDIDGSVYYADADGDGYGLDGGELHACEVPTGVVFTDGDCDDGDSSINPDADELCDAVDRDCDGDPELGASDATTYYADSDYDGVGAEFDTIQSCSPVAGYLSTGGDCDDSDPYFTNYTVYPDADGDGFGDGTAVGIQGCDVAPFVLDNTDCDDTVSSNYPGAPELCDGGIDNDCDPLTDENLVAVWYEDADGDGFGDEGNTYMGCDPLGSSTLLNPTQIGGDCDDTDPDFNPVQTPDCIKDHCGTISGDEVWVAGVEHIVSCDVDVEGPDKPKLTIEDGAVVVFQADAALVVGDGESGSIDVQGFDVGVLFTSAATVPQEGDYEGLIIGSNSEPSYVQGLTVEYGGSTGGGLQLEGGEVTVWESVLFRNSGDGIHVSGGEPLIYDTMMINNENNGLYVEAFDGLSRLDKDGTPGPSFTGNYIAGNGGRPVTVPGSHADELDLSSELNDVYNANVTVEIELLSGIMRSTGTWQRHPEDPTGVVTTDGIPYYVAPTVTIEVEDGPQAQLTIADGVEAYWDDSAELEVGVGAEGSLFVGAPGAPGNVRFTATNNLIVNGLNWDGVEIGPSDGGSEIYGLIVEYGGANGRGNIYVNASAPIIADSEIRYSDTNGIEVAGTTAAPLIQRNLIEDNDENGVYIASSSGIARDPFNNPTFVDNEVINNGLSAVVVPPNFVGELDGTTLFAGNGEYIAIHGGTVLEDATWQTLDEPYLIDGSIDIQGPQDPTVVINPGAQFYADRGTYFAAGEDDDGSLVIVAPPSNRVVFQSADPAPGPGDWDGLRIGENGILFPQSQLQGLEIHHAGGAGTTPKGALSIVLQSGLLCTGNIRDTVVVDDIHLVDSSKFGIALDERTSLSASNVTTNRPLDGYAIASLASPGCTPPEVLAFDTPTFIDVAFVGYLPAAEVQTFDNGTPYPGGIFINDDNTIEDTVLPDLDIDPLSLFPWDYAMEEAFTVGGVGGHTMTIQSGVDIRFMAGVDLMVGDNNLPGTLVIEDNVYLGPYDTTYWEGIDIGSFGTVDIGTANVDYAGQQGDGAVRNDGGSGTIDGLVVTNTVNGVCDYYDGNLESYPPTTCTVGQTCVDVLSIFGSVCF